MITQLLVVVLVAAVAVMTRRRWRRARLHRLAEGRPGASAALAIPVTAFDEIDDHLRRRRCPCGGYLERSGEGSRSEGGQRYRVARLTCQDCDRVDEVFFDTTDLVH